MAGLTAALASNVGRIRANNQDSGYRGYDLFVVADGMGGHAGGDVASAIAIDCIRRADRRYATTDEAKNELERALRAANEQLSDSVIDHPELAGMGTTVDAVARADDQLVVAHIGDSRVYRMHDGRLEQITVDHTFVQRLVETGRITPEEALVHPRRSVLMRVLGDVEANPQIDVSVHPLVPGDRWLLCSDGLSSYVDEAAIARLLRSGGSPEQVVDELVNAALEAGGADNITVLLVDVLDGADRLGEPEVLGSAAAPIQYTSARRSGTRIASTLRHPIRVVTQEETHYEPKQDEYLDRLIAEDRRRAFWRRVRWATVIAIFVAIVAVGAVLGYRWTQTRYYIGVADGQVAVYQGVQQTIGPISLSHVYRTTDLDLDDLGAYNRERVEATISFDSLDGALATIELLRAEAQE